MAIKGRKKAIYFPTKKGSVTGYVDNAHGKLAAGLDVKYSISSADMTKSNQFKTNIPQIISDAYAAKKRAKELNTAKDKMIYQSKVFYNRIGRDMQDHANYDAADLENLGFFV